MYSPLSESFIARNYKVHTANQELLWQFNSLVISPYKIELNKLYKSLLTNCRLAASLGPAIKKMSALNKHAARDLVWLNIVRQQVHSLEFGVVQVVVHDSRVVQIERTEKLRLDKLENETFARTQPEAFQTPGGSKT